MLIQVKLILLHILYNKKFVSKLENPNIHGCHNKSIQDIKQPITMMSETNYYIDCKNVYFLKVRGENNYKNYYKNFMFNIILVIFF